MFSRLRAYRTALFVVAALYSLAACDAPEDTVQFRDPPAVDYADAVEETKRLRLTFSGDLMAHNVNFNMDDYAMIYEDIREILQTDDLSFTNLEFSIDPLSPYATWPRFNVHDDYVEAAVDAGFDVFSLANNHTTDMFLEGTIRTYETMRAIVDRADRPIYFSGLSSETFDLKTTEIRRQGLRIGFAAITGFLNLRESSDGADYVYLYPFHLEEVQNSLIAWLEQEAAKYDLYVLSAHHGIEYRQEPASYKVDFFTQAIEAGVDIVWSHHPHVLQPITWAPRSDGTRGLIMYSLGNLISGQTWYLTPDEWYTDRANTGDAALVRVAVEFDEEGPRIAAAYPELITHYIDPAKDIFARRMRNIIRTPLPEDWNRYYDVRTGVMRRFVRPAADPYLAPPELRSSGWIADRRPREDIAVASRSGE